MKPSYHVPAARYRSRPIAAVDDTQFVDNIPSFATISATMSQDLMRQMTVKGEGAGHVYYVRYNNKNKKDPSAKFTTKKYNKFTRKHEEYKQKK